jgi:flagellar biosynthetic protein FliQ
MSMTGPQFLDIGREAIWLTLKIGGPLLIVALVVGFAISLVQALTQIQEMTLSFVPKILAIFLSLMLFLPYMGFLLESFSQELFVRIADMRGP